MRIVADTDRQEKSALNVAYDTYKEFAENTGIHGIRYTVVSDTNRFEKTVWFISVIMGITGAGYMTTLFWERFMSNPTRTSILTDFAPINEIAFPAVTICNANRILGSKIEEFMSKLIFESKEEEEFVQNTIPQLLTYVSPNSINHSANDLTTLHRILVRNGHNDPAEIMGALSQTCAEMIVKCAWDIFGEDCKTMFTTSITAEGPCCSFNYYVTSKLKRAVPKRTMYSGFQHGLILLLDPALENIQYSSLHASGMKVYIHNFRTFPDTNTFTRIVSVGRQTFLQIFATMLKCSSGVQRLSVKQRKCVYPKEKQLKYFNDYDKSNCLTECHINNYAKRCGCVPFYFSFTDIEVCNISRIPCLDATRTDKNLILDSSKECDCPTECEQIFYDVMSTSATFYYDPNLATSSFLSDQSRKITDNSIVMSIYFGRQTHTILLRDTITSSTYLLSSFGGVYSLFMGCSFITLVELIYYIFIRFFIKLKLLTKVEHRHQNKGIMQREIDTISYPRRLMYHNRKDGVNLFYDNRAFIN